jgi:hypothetical protein
MRGPQYTNPAIRMSVERHEQTSERPDLLTLLMQGKEAARVGGGRPPNAGLTTAKGATDGRGWHRQYHRTDAESPLAMAGVRRFPIDAYLGGLPE